MANQFKKYENFKKTLNKEGKRKLRDSIFFLRTAMISAMTIELVNNFMDFVDNEGWAEFYEIAMEVCDEVLLTNDSEFLVYIKLFIDGDERAEDYFAKFDSMYDWFFMELARKELKERIEEHLE